MRRLAAVLTFLALATGASVPSPTHGASLDLQARLARALAAPGIAPRRTAALAIDLTTGETVYAKNAGVSLLPASTEKLAVSLAALRLLGPGYRFRTDVVGAGTLEANVWNGDLFLVGHGDPTLALSDMGVLARRIRSWGIHRVNGRVFGDEHYLDSRRDAPGWKPSFLGIESRPLSALSVLGAAQRGANGSAAAAAESLITALERRGVGVSGKPGSRRTPGDAVPVTSDVSSPLVAVVRHMNHESDNFYAETILKDLGAEVAGHGSSEAGGEIVASALADAGVPLSGVRVADGSGLSLEDRQTSRSLVAILQAGAADPAIRKAFVASLSVAGVSGTLEDRLDRSPTRGRVVAKTGTTNDACALAGYVGQRYVFAILQNGSPVPYWNARAAQDRFVTVLASK
jgi:D-alanyl-D-alanine carboxypeptidase/D-alanyl-D-alanine-endopeptidase (penicillin-binding protein 4)